MQPLVHVAIGAVVGLAVSLAAGFELPRRRLAVAAGAIWGSIPDCHLALDASGVDALAREWAAFHDSGLANLFWLHRVVDRNETQQYLLEDVLAGIVLLAVLVALRPRSDADDPRERR